MSKLKGIQLPRLEGEAFLLFRRGFNPTEISQKVKKSLRRTYELLTTVAYKVGFEMDPTRRCNAFRKWRVLEGLSFYEKDGSIFVHTPDAEVITKDCKVIKFSPACVKVIKMIRDGWSNKEISSKLELSIGTVSYHISMAKQALGIRSCATNVALVFEAMKHGLI